MQQEDKRIWSRGRGIESDEGTGINDEVSKKESAMTR
jgi:hypothetical protein